MAIAMKDVVTLAPAPVLVTGFGAFPGAPSNPTLAILDRLEAEGVAGVPLRLARLPVSFAAVAPALREAAACRPSALLMLGLARRRRTLCVETLARNRAGRTHPDNDGAVPAGIALVEGGPATIAASWPAGAVLAALHDGGHDAVLSDDAGDYVCNAALFHALRERQAPVVGFLHVPPHAPTAADGPTIETTAAAVRRVVGVLVRGDPSYEIATSAG